MRFHRPLRVNAPFRKRVQALEVIVSDTAIEIYGRPPSRIRHLGAFYCRRISTWPYLVSEHGLGNAIDIAGFSFDRLSGDEQPTVPAQWRKRFEVRMTKHWNATGSNAPHSRFLQLLARRLIDADVEAEADATQDGHGRESLFRVILGPAQPNHDDHLHLDMARWRIVNVF